jgi:hypothetical protein
VILSLSSYAEIFFPVVESLAVFVVNDETRRRLHNLTMHRYEFSFAVLAAEHSNGVKIIINASCRIPFMGIQLFEILRVNDSEFALRELDFPEYAAVVANPVAQEKPYAEAF